MNNIREYIDLAGGSPFADWFAGLNAAAAAKITVHLKRMELGNLANVEPVGEGVLEKKIDWGPGYRIYFGRDSNAFVLLLVGSDKSDQRKAIKRAQEYWQDYRKRRRSVEHGAH
jgi:putative addiction module killer protein